MKSAKQNNNLFALIALICTSLLICLLVTFYLITLDDENKAAYIPHQIHIALGDDNEEIVVAWSTRSDPKQSIVRYGYNCSHIYKTARSDVRRLLDNEGSIQYIHIVSLKHLDPQTKYCYLVGSHNYWSKPYEFITFPVNQHWSPSVAVVGDMGVQNGRSIPSLIQNARQGKYDAVLHIGDIGYNLYAYKGQIGNSFMQAIQPFAAIIPYMVIPGNHEYLCYDDRCPGDFGTNYETRFKMPKTNDNMYYTFTMGPALFVAINTEVYFESEMSDLEASQRQKKWLREVLKEANEPQNRARHPWIIVYGHRPLYCTGIAECFEGLTFFKKEGAGSVGSLYDIDDILYEFGVDLAFWGHQHYYERMFPVYNQTVYKNTMYDNAFVNPRATVHIVSGTGGMHSGTEPFNEIPAAWSAQRSSAYGYTRFTVLNETHLYLEQIDVDQDDLVIDSIWIIQSNHIPFKIKNEDLIFH